MSCTCVLSFILMLSGGVGTIDPASLQWSPQRCAKSGPHRAPQSGPVVMFRGAFFGQKETVFLPLPSRNLNGRFIYRYCWGEAFVEVNGAQHSVILMIEEHGLA